MPDNKEMLHQFSGENEDVRFMLKHFIKMLDGVVNKHNNMQIMSNLLMFEIHNAVPIS